VCYPFLSKCIALRLSPRDPFSAVYYGIAAYAQFIGRNYEEAIRLAREAIRQRGDFVGAHRVLTAAAGMAGQNDIANVALQHGTFDAELSNRRLKVPSDQSVVPLALFLR
jgi:hypothetical protein